MSIYVTLTGTFRFEINQNGLDFDNPEDREYAIKDFINEMKSSMENNHRDCIDITYDYDENDIKLEQGE